MDGVDKRVVNAEHGVHRRVLTVIRIQVREERRNGVLFADVFGPFGEQEVGRASFAHEELIEQLPKPVRPERKSYVRLPVNLTTTTERYRKTVIRFDISASRCVR